MAILLDTSFYVGLIDKKSPYHARAQKYMKELAHGKYGKIYTTDHIFNEVMTIINRKSKGRFRDSLLKLAEFFIGEGQIAEMLIIKPDWFTEVVTRMVEFTAPNIPITFTDASSLVICYKNQIDKILVLDKSLDKTAIEFQIIQ